MALGTKELRLAGFVVFAFSATLIFRATFSSSPRMPVCFCPVDWDVPLFLFTLYAQKLILMRIFLNFVS